MKVERSHNKTTLRFLNNEIKWDQLPRTTKIRTRDLSLWTTSVHFILCHKNQKLKKYPKLGGYKVTPIKTKKYHYTYCIELLNTTAGIIHHIISLSIKGKNKKFLIKYVNMLLTDLNNLLDIYMEV